MLQRFIRMNGVIAHRERLLIRIYNYPPVLLDRRLVSVIFIFIFVIFFGIIISLDFAYGRPTPPKSFGDHGFIDVGVDEPTNEGSFLSREFASCVSGHGAGVGESLMNSKKICRQTHLEIVFARLVVRAGTEESEDSSLCGPMSHE